MTVSEIISQIWDLPWHKVLWIAVTDDFIFVCKIWPVYVVLFIIYIAALIRFSWRRKWPWEEEDK